MLPAKKSGFKMIEKPSDKSESICLAESHSNVGGCYRPGNPDFGRRFVIAVYDESFGTGH